MARRRGKACEAACAMIAARNPPAAAPPPAPRPFFRAWRAVCLLGVVGALLVGSFLAPPWGTVVWQLHEHTGHCSLAALAARREEPDMPFARYERAYEAGAAAAARRVDFVWVTATPNLCWASVQSVCATFRGEGTLHVVVPDTMLAHFERDAAAGRYTCANATALPARLHAESALVPAFTGGAAARARYPGTLRQMALKLAAADVRHGVVETPFFVVMDSDVFARRPFGVADLLVEDETEVLVSVAAAGANRVQQRTRRVRRQRARTDFDFERGKQPAAWRIEAARALQTRLVRSTDEACAAASLWPGPEPVFSAGRDTPFALRFSAAGRAVHSACHHGVGMTTHVTPMILSTELVRNVVIARLEELYGGGSGGGASGGGEGGRVSATAAAAAAYSAASAAAVAPSRPAGGGETTGLAWLDGLVAFHDEAARQCDAFSTVALRFYSWTEYSLYFVAAAASGALDDFHAFDFGWLSSFRHSVFDPRDHKARAEEGWDAVFADAADPALLVIVQSWMHAPYTDFFAAMRRHLTLHHAEGLGEGDL